MVTAGTYSLTHKPGDRGSRVKREKALSYVNFKIQVTLTGHMAISEKLESVPIFFWQGYLS